MQLLTPTLIETLRVNAVLGAAAEIAIHEEQERRAALPREAGEHDEPLPRFDPVPVVKFFNPCGAATWLATELYDDGDTLFGLADLGVGFPELGVFSLAELQSIRARFGLGIERDLGFSTPHPLSVWADTARRTESIIAAQSLLASTAPPDLPANDNESDAG